MLLQLRLLRFCSFRVVSPLGSYCRLLPAFLAFPAFPFVLHNYALSCERASLSCLASLQALYLITVHISQISLTLPPNNSSSSSRGDPFVNLLPCYPATSLSLRCLLQVAVASAGSTHYHYHRQRQLHYAHYTFHFEWFSRYRFTLSLSLSVSLRCSAGKSSVADIVLWFLWRNIFSQKISRQRETSFNDPQALSLSFFFLFENVSLLKWYLSYLS